MDQLFAQLCMLLQLNSNLPSNACTSSFTAMYTGSKVKNEVDFTENFYQGKVQERAYNLLGKNTIYGGIGVYAIGDAYVKKEIKFATPLKPLCDNISVDWTETSQSYLINWKWNL